MSGFGTHENHFLLEAEGVSVVSASEVTMPDREHTPFELYVGNDPDPMLGRGLNKVGELLFKHAYALNEAHYEVMDWLEEFSSGRVERRTFRLIVLDEDGATPNATWEMQDCVPTRMKPEPHNASGNNAAMFTFGLRPSRMVLL